MGADGCRGDELTVSTSMHPNPASGNILTAARQLIATKQYPEAERLLRHGISQDERCADLPAELASLAFSQRRPDVAVQWLERALLIEPTHPEWRLAAANGYAALGHQAAAIRHAQHALELRPESVVAQILFAKLLQRQGKGSEACTRLEILHRQQPISFEVLKALVETLITEGRTEEALQFADAAAEASDALGVLMLNAQCACEDGDVAKATLIYRRAISAHPDSVEAILGLAQALEDRGDREGAEAAYKRALQLDTKRGFAIGALLELQGKNADQQWIERGLEILEGGAATDVARALVGYGLGKVFSKRHQPRAAFSCWKQANEARRREIGAFDRAHFSSRIDNLIEIFSTTYFRKNVSSASDDKRPLFVVGMPRSGTTLVEQIFASHPLVLGYGELPDIPRIAGQMAREMGQRWPQSMLHIDSDIARRYAQRYQKTLARRGAPTAQRCVDKAPTNFLYLGLIATLFPNAHVIWCRRDARDVCLSIYAENFGLTQRHATDLGDLAAYHREHERIMRHWQTVLPLPIHEVSYEALIDQPQAVISSMLTAVKLDWSDTCLNFYAGDRLVQTPSKWQVRQPLYRSSVGKWKEYERWLGPLLTALNASETESHDHHE